MNIDWAIAIAIFVVLFSWSVFYYTDVLRPTLISIPDVSEKIFSQFSVEKWTVPVKFSQENESNNTILYANIDWRPESIKNTTRVWNGSHYLPCKIIDSKLYWQANLAAGNNYFWITYYNKSEDLRCSDDLNLSEANLTLPGVAQKSEFVSTYKLNQFLDSNYTEVRPKITDRNFRIIVDWMNGSISDFGPNPPNIGNILSKQMLSATDEGGQIRIIFLMW